MLVFLFAGACTLFAPDATQAESQAHAWTLDAPQACGDEASFRARLSEAGASDALELSFEVDATESGFEGRLEIRGEASGRRLFLQSESCETLIRSVVLVLADGAVPESTEPAVPQNPGTSATDAPTTSAPPLIPEAAATQLGSPVAASEPSQPPESLSPPVAPVRARAPLAAPARRGWSLAAGAGAGAQLGTAVSARFLAEARYAWPMLRAAFAVAGGLPRSYSASGSGLRWSRLELLPRVAFGTRWTQRWSGSLGVLGSFSVEFARSASSQLSSSTDMGLGLGADARLSCSMSERLELELQLAGLGAMRRTALFLESETLVAPGALRGYGALALIVHLGGG